MPSVFVYIYECISVMKLVNSLRWQEEILNVNFIDFLWNGTTEIQSRDVFVEPLNVLKI